MSDLYQTQPYGAVKEISLYFLQLLLTGAPYIVIFLENVFQRLESENLLLFERTRKLGRLSYIQ